MQSCNKEIRNPGGETRPGIRKQAVEPFPGLLVSYEIERPRFKSASPRDYLAFGKTTELGKGVLRNLGQKSGQPLMPLVLRVLER